MEVLSSRVLVRPSDLERSIAFYRDQLGLRIYREYGAGASRGVVFFIGGGHLEVSGSPPPPDLGHEHVSLWLQVPDIEAAHRALLERGVTVVEPPARKPWGLLEMWIADPDGVGIVVVEVPDDHPLRRRVS